MAAEESGQSCLESNLTVCKARASTCRFRIKNKSEQTSGEACVQQAYVAANDPHAWFCDLCSHGDVHPNPGPPSAIPIWSCNVGRGAGSWEFVKLGISQQIPIFAIQEGLVKFIATCVLRWPVPPVTCWAIRVKSFHKRKRCLGKPDCSINTTGVMHGRVRCRNQTLPALHGFVPMLSRRTRASYLRTFTSTPQPAVHKMPWS